MNGFYSRSFRNSLAGHGVALVLAVVVSLCAGWIKRKPKEIPLEFTVVIEEAQEAAPKPADRRQPKPPEPPKPPPPPPVDAVVPIDKPKVEKTKPKPEPPKPEPPKPVPPKPEQPKPKPTASGFKKGERVVREVKSPVQPVRLARQPMLSAEEITRLLAAGATVGEENKIPQDEVQMCFLFVKRALYEAWVRPSRTDAGARPTQIELTFGPGGVIANVRMVRSSGSVIHDRSAVAAGRAAGRVNGLTARFLREYPRITVDFELE